MVAPQVLHEAENGIAVLRKEMGQMRGERRALEGKYRALLEATQGGGKAIEKLVEEVERLKRVVDEGKTGGAEDKDGSDEGHAPEGNFFEARGESDEGKSCCLYQGRLASLVANTVLVSVPEFLRYTGSLRNWRLSKRECERAVNDVWIAKEEVRREGTCTDCRCLSPILPCVT